MDFRQYLHLFVFFLVVGLAASSRISISIKAKPMPKDHHQCLDNPPILDSKSGEGKVQEIAGLNCYVSGTTNSKVSIIMISDVFGYEAPTLRMIADKVAAAGFYVVLPDFFHGDPYVSKQPFTPWIKKHSPDKGFEEAKPLIEALKSQGITKIGAAGFCWGGKVAVELSENSYIQAAVLLHPSLVSVDDIKGVKVPMSILGAENDTLSPPALVKQFEDALKAKHEIDSYVKIFPGVEHGWTIRYNHTDPKAVQSAEEAHKEMLDWLVKYTN